MSPHRYVTIFLIILVLLLSSGCVHKNKDFTDIEQSDDIAEDEQRSDLDQKDIDSTPKIKSPLTGLDIDAKYEGQKPLAVMIENEYKSRPQSGLDKAGVVYEVMAEGGITRFLALYMGAKCDEIGPIRSARPYLIDYAMEFDSIYVHYGASPEAYRDLQKQKINTIDGIYDNVTFWRDPSRKKPHNAYSSEERILKTAEKRGMLKRVALKLWNFNDTNETTSGTALDSFKLVYYKNYNVGYIYDPTIMMYKRYINGAPHTDRKSGEPIYVKNIIIQYSNSKVIDDEGRLRIDTPGSGKGYYISNGFVQEIDWQKMSRNSRTIYYDKDGLLLKINPGNTWIQVLNQSSKFERNEI